MADVSATSGISSEPNCPSGNENVEEIVEDLLDSMVQLASTDPQNAIRSDQPTPSPRSMNKSPLPCSSGMTTKGSMPGEDSDVELLEGHKDRLNTNNSQQVENITCEVALGMLLLLIIKNIYVSQFINLAKFYCFKIY